MDELKKLRSTFKSMSITAHYRTRVERPAAVDVAELRAYNAEIDKTPTKSLFIPMEKKICFYTLALNFLEGFIHNNKEEKVEPVILRASRYGLQAVHIFALGIRACTAEVIGLGQTPGGRAARLSVTPRERLDGADCFSNLLMYGAWKASGNGNDSDEKDRKTKKQIHNKHTKMTYKQWCTRKRKKEAEVRSQKRILLKRAQAQAAMQEAVQASRRTGLGAWVTTFLLPTATFNKLSIYFILHYCHLHPYDPLSFPHPLRVFNSSLPSFLPYKKLRSSCIRLSSG